MKPDPTRDTVPNRPEPPDAAHPGEAGLRASERPTHPPPARRPVDDVTIPDPVDVERLILSLERKPSPPAPMPEERASSDGGRFVAYRGTSRPAAPHSPEEIRRKALAELSIMVNATPVPPEGDGRNASTARLYRRGRTTRRAQIAWALVAFALTLAAVVSVIVVTTRPAQSSFASAPAALVLATTAAPPAPSTPSRVTLPPLPTPGPIDPPTAPISVAEPRAAERANSPVALGPSRVAPAPATKAPAAVALAASPEGAGHGSADGLGSAAQPSPRASAGAPPPVISPTAASAQARSFAKPAFERW